MITSPVELAEISKFRRESLNYVAAMDKFKQNLRHYLRTKKGAIPEARNILYRLECFL